ncbi:MAG: type III-A CRISPR-associated protein Csm2 [Candidatus Thermoplasmatota archaeon]
MNKNIVDEVKANMEEILKGNGEKIVEMADKIGKYIGGDVTTSQIRNIYGEVMRMHKFDKNNLQLLRAKLAYTAGRHGKKRGEKLEGGIVHLQEILDEAIRKVNDEKSFENFKNFFEAILAYHKYHGGKD